MGRWTKLDLNIHFVKNLLSHIALSMITPLGRRCINASDYLPCKIDPSKKLYLHMVQTWT